MTPDERAEFIQDITSALRPRAADVYLSEDEKRWVQLAIKKEAQSIAFRQSVIDKTTTGLVWAFLVWVGIVFMEWAVKHGYRP